MYRAFLIWEIILKMAFYPRDQSLQLRYTNMISPWNSGQNFGREFSHFKREMNGRLNDINKTINATLAEHRTSSKAEVIELKQDILSLQKA